MLKSKVLASRALRLARNQDKIVIQKLCQTVTDDEKEKELQRIAKDASIDEPPTSCCQSGCSNCVFIVWAEALTKNMKNTSPEIAKKMLDLVEDPSMKAYLEMELRLRGMKK